MSFSISARASSAAPRRAPCLSRVLWAIWAFGLPFLVTGINLGLGSATLGRDSAGGVLGVLAHAVIDGMLTGLAAVFFLRVPLSSRVAFGLLYASAMILLLGGMSLYLLL